MYRSTKPKTTSAIAISSVAGAAGGFVYNINSDNEIPVVHSLISGALIGTIGSIIFAQKIADYLKQAIQPAHIFAAGAIFGLAYNPSINFVLSTVRAKSTLDRLEKQVSEDRIANIQQLEAIATTENGADRKAIALEELTQISNDEDVEPKILEEAVEASTAIAQKSAPELKIEQIKRYQELYNSTDDPELKAKILADLEGFATGEYSIDVTQAAWGVLELISDVRFQTSE